MKEKKIAAAVSAVLAYIKTEEEMAPMQSTSPTQPKMSETASTGFNFWGLSGRQSMMNMRTMMQLKSFHGSKIR
ncbi:MAG: hypothetical protein C0403_14455 [Desulfobacterium sp.]|nr:hypothetical protein [Desulfobacterium sp.]